MWDIKYLIYFGLICVAFWLVEKFLMAKRKNTHATFKKQAGREDKEPESTDLEHMLEGAELVAFIRNEKLFLTTSGQWLFIQQLKDRLNYSTYTPWEARNFILKHIHKKEGYNHADKKAEMLKIYDLKGDKKDLHFPYVDKKIRGKMMIKT